MDKIHEDFNKTFGTDFKLSLWPKEGNDKLKIVNAYGKTMTSIKTRDVKLE